MIIHNPILTGSFTVNGVDALSITSSAANITSLNAATASLNSFSASVLTFTASAATTGSNTFVGNQVVSGSLTVSSSITTPGTLTAQTLVVQTITSSVDFVTGSTRFGSLSSNTHVFTGSISVSGSANFSSGSDVTLSKITTPVGIEYQVRNANGASGNHVFKSFNTAILTLDGGTNAATFASSVTATNAFFNASNGFGLAGRNAANTQYRNLIILNSGNQIEIGRDTDISQIRIGTASSNDALTIASNGAATFASSISATNAIFSGRLGVGISSDQTYASIFVGGDITSGVNQYAIITDPQLSGTSNSYALFANARIKASTAVTNAFGIYIPSAEKLSGATITNNYALYIANQTSGGTLNYSIYSSGGVNYFGGNVGIGTSSPGGFLEVSSADSGNTQILLVRNYATSATGNFTGNYTAEIRATSNGNVRHAMLINNQENDSTRRVLDITSLFGTIASFVSNGNVGIGTTSPAEKLHIYGGGSGPEIRLEGGYGSWYIRAYNDNFNVYTPSGRQAVSYLNNGDVRNYNNTTTWQTTSDFRVKENINTINNAMDKILSLNPVIFDYKQEFADKNNWDNNKKNNNVGFIAQEFETIFPKYISTNKYEMTEIIIDDLKSIDTGHLVAYLVKAIQELKAEVDALKAQ